MKPAAETSDARPDGRHHRRVRLFVALHLGAVGAIYAIAVVAGGGFTGPPMPPLTVAIAMMDPQPVPASVSARVTTPSAQTVQLTPVPEWTRRPEIAAPWESR